MSTFDLALIRSQVTGPVAQTPLFITLSGYHNFDIWHRTLMEHAVACSDEWYFFLKNGSLNGLYKEGEVSVREIRMATAMLQNATRKLILQSCSESIVEELMRAIENGKCESSGLAILKYLEQEFSNPTVENLYPFFKRLSTLRDMSLEDRRYFFERLVALIRQIPEDKNDMIVESLMLGSATNLRDKYMLTHGRGKDLTIMKY